MRENKYVGVYYSDNHFKDLNAFTTFSLFFDEIHLVTNSTTLSGKEPTEYFKKLPDKVQIAFPNKASEDEISKVQEFTQFILNNKPLIGNTLFYHNDMVAGSISTFSQKLLNGKVSIDEFMSFMSANTDEIRNFDKFKNDNPEITDNQQLGISSTAYNLSKKNDWILIGDQSNVKLPFTSEDENNVKLLTSIIAEECFRIVLPKSVTLDAENILVARDKLKDDLVPFRLTLQKMSLLLRDGIKNSKNIDDVRKEAKFLTESQIEPVLHEITRRIEIEKDKLWTKIFGSAVSWIPLIAKGYVAPSPDNLFKVMDKVYGDVGNIAASINEFNLAKEPGLRYLLRTDNIIKKISP
jgi:hypothetical protein